MHIYGANEKKVLFSNEPGENFRISKTNHEKIQVMQIFAARFSDK